MVLPLIPLILPLLPAAGHFLAGHVVSQAVIHGATGLTAQIAQHAGGRMAVNLIQGVIANPGLASAGTAITGLGTAAQVAEQSGSKLFDGIGEGIDRLARFLDGL